MAGHASCTSSHPVNPDADNSLPPHPPDGRLYLPLEPLDQLAVGGDEGLLGFNFSYNGLLSLKGRERYLDSTKVGSA